MEQLLKYKWLLREITTWEGEEAAEWEEVEAEDVEEEVEAEAVELGKVEVEAIEEVVTWGEVGTPGGHHPEAPLHPLDPPLEEVEEEVRSRILNYLFTTTVYSLVS
jgi:hypothetical protein